MSSICKKLIKKIHAQTFETDELGKAKSFRFCSLKRPFMRSFHTSWFCFFVAFTSWFGIQPLLPTIRKELNLTKKDLAHSGMASVAATIAIRVVVGPLCDRFGPRRVMSLLLLIGSIPMALAGLIKSATGLIVLRLCIGVLGGAFVPCQFWTTAMFNVKVVGTANALVGGWGNLGGGFTFIFMPGIFELVKLCGADEFLAWKIAVAVPAAICILLGVCINFTSDDCPQGKWKDRVLPKIHEETITVPGNKVVSDTTTEPHDYPVFESDIEGNKTKPGLEQFKEKNQDKQNDREVSEGKTCGDICNLFSTYFTIAILVVQYGLCFGVEISINTILNLYLLYEFKIEGCEENALPPETNTTSMFNQTTFTSGIPPSSTLPTTTVTHDLNTCSILDQNTASLITSLFGLMNLFARAIGGIFSDVLRKYQGLPGRLLALYLCLFVEGILLIIFSQIRTIPLAIVTTVILSLFVQMSEGATYAVVPYVLLHRVGIVAGFVGAGGNAGALIWNVIWSHYVTSDPRRYFWTIGVIVLSGSLLCFLAVIQKARIFHMCQRKKKQEATFNSK